MPILTGDIKLVASQVMDDVPEGGGAPTATVITDGTSNAIFPDISELDRAGGRVNLRKLHVSVQTMDTDTYMGSNIIVSEPPADPNVSVTLFSTRDTFDRRDAASARVESYLTKGPMWGGMLLENHIAGQRAVQILQGVDAELPRIGQTMVLVQNEGATNERNQYIRTTEVSAVKRKFEDSQGKMVDMNVVTCSISDALRTDFQGSEGNAKAAPAAGATRIRDTTVADAGSYVGVVPLAAAANLGTFSIRASSVYTQLVPSAQTETPLVDLKPNGEQVVLSAAGGPMTITTSVALNTSHTISVGQAIMPNTLKLTTGSLTLVDDGGLLSAAGSAVGAVDYANGLISITDPSVSYAGAKTIIYTPAATPVRSLHTASWAVTAESRSSTLVAIFDPAPKPGSFALSYRAQGRWYTLRDAGNGQLRSAFGSVGAGTLNFNTGSMMVTLAALPDAGTQVLATYGLATADTAVYGTAIAAQSVFTLANAGVAPGTVTLTWVTGGVDKTAADNGQGLLTGDATGKVDYLDGLITFKPLILPSSGAQVSIEYSWGPPIEESFQAPERFAPDGHIEIVLANPNVLPRTVKVEWNTVYDEKDLTIEGQISTRWLSLTYKPRVDPIVIVHDNGAGGFQTRPECAGVIIYAAGTLSFKPDTVIALPKPNWTKVVIGTQVFDNAWFSGTLATEKTVFGGFIYQTIGAIMPTDMSGYVKVTYRTSAAGTTNTEVFSVNFQIDLTQSSSEPIVGGSCSFTLGGTRFVDRQGSLITNIDPATGSGLTSGSINYSTGMASLTVLPVGAPNSGVITSMVTSQSPMPVTDVQFRTSTAPIRPSSLAVQFVLADDDAQVSHIVTSDANGRIESANVTGKVDYETGIVSLAFGKWELAAGNETKSWYDASKIIGGHIFVASAVMADSIRYAAVAYSYLPLDANILGIDPVRLPSDGRVPIFRPGGFAVVGNTQSITATVTNGQTINCARVRLSRVRVVGFDGNVINSGYSVDLEAGMVTFSAVAGYSQPVRIEHRVEDMAVVSDVQISGELTFTRPLTHEYPITSPPSSFVSSALIAGDLKARVSVLFDQATWNGTTWLDGVSGTAATGTFNDVLAPIVVTNKGAVSERWALVFTNTTSFNVIGEHVGVIAIGSTNTDLSPNNPATNTPYFKVPALGWGIGWAAGNMLRFNTVGAMTPVWVVRTIQQGPNTGIQHSFTLLSRGDVDRP